MLCKDGDGKVGLRVKAIDKGIFVALVAQGSPASMGGLKFGDQILQINNVTIAGYTAEKVHGMFKSCGVNNIVLAVRDRYVLTLYQRFFKAKIEVSKVYVAKVQRYPLHKKVAFSHQSIVDLFFQSGGF